MYVCNVHTRLHKQTVKTDKLSAMNQTVVLGWYKLFPKSNLQLVCFFFKSSRVPPDDVWACIHCWVVFLSIMVLGEHVCGVPVFTCGQTRYTAPLWAISTYRWDREWGNLKTDVDEAKIRSNKGLLCSRATVINKKSKSEWPSCSLPNLPVKQWFTAELKWTQP